MNPSRPSRGAMPGYGAAGAIRNLLWALATLVALAGAAAAEVRILAFGDSLTAGFGLPAEQGFVPQLQTWLRAHGAPDATVINAGVSGDTTAGGLARLDWALGDDVDAVIVELGANDMLRGLDVGEMRRNLDAILTQIDARAACRWRRAPRSPHPHRRRAPSRAAPAPRRWCRPTPRR